jgi:hypothetical protein
VCRPGRRRFPGGQSQEGGDVNGFGIDRGEGSRRLAGCHLRDHSHDDHAGSASEADLIQCKEAGSFGTVSGRIEKLRLKAFPKRSGDFLTYIISRTARQGVSRSKLVENWGVVLVN